MQQGVDARDESGHDEWMDTRPSSRLTMPEKAEATAKRIEQSMSELERQISWATRPYSNTIDLRRADYEQLLRQVPYVSQLSLLNAQGREQLRRSRLKVTEGSNLDFSRDV